MTKGQDDLEAVRLIAETLQPFNDSERERILRWVRERLGMAGAHGSQGAPDPRQTQAPAVGLGGTRDIRSFIQAKKPMNERHLAAVVAYYHQLEAPADQRKESISSQDLIDACRTANWARPKNPSQTLINAFRAGYIDKAGERGKYRLNAVGENLVAMVLPETDAGGGAGATAPKKGRQRKKRANTKHR